MDNKLIVTQSDNFVFVDVTDHAESLFEILELYICYSDDSQSLVDTIYDIRRAIEQGNRIGIEGGHIPKQRSLSFKDADKVLVGGYWYGKYSQILN